MAEYPAAPRVFAGAAALFFGSWFGAAQPGFLWGSGYPVTAAVMLATVLPLVMFLAAVALVPGWVQRGLSRWTRLDLRERGHAGAAVLMAATLYVVLGYGSLVGGAFAYEGEVLRGEEASPIGGEALFAGLALNVVVLVVPPVFYIVLVGGEGLAGALDALGVRRRGAARAAFVGVASAFGVLVVIAVASLALTGFDLEVPENERALEIARSVTVLGALGLAVGSSVSEEVFFRGFLQPRIGLWGQAVFFALAHLSYLHVLEVVVTFVLALLFGVIYRATGNLLAPIAGHFAFNLVMLLAGIYAPEAA